MLFERPLPLMPARAGQGGAGGRAARASTSACAHGEDGLSVWGTVRAIPFLCFVVEVAAPGLLVVKHHRGDETGKFVNVAVIEGDQIKIVDEAASSLPDCPPLLTSLLGFDSPASWSAGARLGQRAGAAGGVDAGARPRRPAPGRAAWQRRVAGVDRAADPVRGRRRPFAELAQLTRESRGREAEAAVAGRGQPRGGSDRRPDRGRRRDGPDQRYELLAFGAKIARRKGSPQVEQVTVTEPIEGNVAITVHPTQLGGTRHLSAAQFVHDQRDAVALVASQDGRFTVFAWSPCEGMVHAHRVETLLL